MKITGYRVVRTFLDWGRPVGDANGFVESGVTDAAVVVLETDEGVEGFGMGTDHDLPRLFPALEGQDPRAVSTLYDAMLASVFKSGHGGATFGGRGREGIGARRGLQALQQLGGIPVLGIDPQQLFQVTSGRFQQTHAERKDAQLIQCLFATGGLFGQGGFRRQAIVLHGLSDFTQF